MWWWILAAVVVGVLVVGWLVVRRKRPVSRRPPGRPGPAKTKTTGKNLTPGDIWWADVPYEDGSGSKVRPCLVLRPAGRSVDVLKITSQDQSRRRDHVEIPHSPLGSASDTQQPS